MTDNPIYSLPPWSRELVMMSLSIKERTWGLNQFRIPEAWKVSRGSGVRISVLDTGCDTRHPDLQGQVIEDRDFTHSRYGTMDKQNHGTHCAGVIGAKENDLGVVGICPDISQEGGGLIIGKVLDDSGQGQGDWIAAGIDWACEQGAHIISMSLGSPVEDSRITAAIERATAKGVFVITAAGNDGTTNSVNWPGRQTETITVSAVDKRGRVARFSSRGDQVDIAAPGEDILSTFPNNQYARLSGTSMATPFVAGVVGLILSAQKVSTIGISYLRELLAKHATDAGAPGKDPEYGFGLINPESMLTAATEEESGGLKLGPVTIHVPAKAGDLFSLGIN